MTTEYEDTPLPAGVLTIGRCRVGALEMENESATPLHDAAYEGDEDKVALLIHAYVSIDARDQMGSTALHLAAQKGHLGIVRHLLDCGADINARTNYTLTPLVDAVISNQTEVAQLLLERGASVLWNGQMDARLPKWAVQRENIVLIRLLLAKSGEEERGSLWSDAL